MPLVCVSVYMLHIFLQVVKHFELPKALHKQLFSVSIIIMIIIIKLMSS